MDAEYIITNSFHVMAFFANFKKNFTVLLEGDPATGAIVEYMTGVKILD